MKKISLKKPSKRAFIELFILLLTIIALASSVFFFSLYNKTNTELKKLLTDPQYADLKSKEEAKKLIAEVGKYMLLPQEENPIVATIMDVEKLKAAQPFFINAKNGDKVLVYTKKAIIYDPITKKIIETGPVVPASGSGQVNQTFKLMLLNGTKTTGLTKQYEDSIKAQVSNVEVTKGNAKNTNYTKSIVVDVKGDKSNETQQLAQFLGVEVNLLPSGESKPDADFLVILGSDKETPQASPSSTLPPATEIASPTPIPVNMP